MIPALLLLAIVALVAANALFVAAEFSLISVDRAAVERRADGGDHRAGSVLAALKRLSTQLSGAQLGITGTSLVVGYLAEPAIAQLLRGPLGMAGLSDAATTTVSVALSLILATGFQMVFGELVPKNWGIAEPMRAARIVAGPQRAFTTVTYPLLRMLNGAANHILRLLDIQPQEELAAARSAQELVSLVGRSRRGGVLDDTTATLLSRSLSLGIQTAADAMTPRPRTTFVNSDDPVVEVLREVDRSGKSRFPVAGQSVDDVVGLVHFKHALGVPPDQREITPVGDVMVELPAVPTSMELDATLMAVRDSPVQTVVVVDEYGGTGGIITLEDMVEEIVGEIADEQDRRVRRSRRRPDGSWEISGLLRPDEVAETTSLRLPEPDDSETVAGLVTEHLGRMPEVGDTVHIDGQDESELDEAGLPVRVEVALDVVALDERRVSRIGIRRREGAGHG